ncbi:MAG: hypothetical protein KY467_17815 [Gemmatimonadetes bacterium]|nr:hypothetical protein [Gemmatimonadota bacterium]
MRSIRVLAAAIAAAALSGCADGPVVPSSEAIAPPTGPLASHSSSASVEYQVHMQNYGWEAWVGNGQVAGHPGEGLRLEAFALNWYSGAFNGGPFEPCWDGVCPEPPRVCYQAHVQDYGWQAPVCGNGQYVGTTGQARRMEAVAIWLEGDTDEGICYEVYVQTYGWQGLSCNGQVAGTTGQGLRLEAIAVHTY